MIYDFTTFGRIFLFRLWIVLIFFFSHLAFCSQKKIPIYPIESDFSLTDHDRKEFRLSQLKGKTILLYFGFTKCPDVCPQILSRIQRVYRLLGLKKHLLQTIMITLDPEYDQPKVLKKYLSNYNISALGLHGSTDKIQRIQKQYGSVVQYAVEAGTFDKHQVGHISHSTHIFLLDPESRVRFLFRPNDSPRKMAGIIRQVTPFF